MLYNYEEYQHLWDKYFESQWEKNPILVQADVLRKQVQLHDIYGDYANYKSKYIGVINEQYNKFKMKKG
jgi:hypothetical protein